MMLSTWTKITVVPEPTKLQDIIVEEAQQKVQENKKHKDVTAVNISNKSENYNIVCEDISIHLGGESDTKSDEMIARMLQKQYDKENVSKRIKPTVNTSIKLVFSDDSDNKLVQNLDEQSESEEEEEWVSQTVKQEISKYDMTPTFPGKLKKYNIRNSSHCSLKPDGTLSQHITRKLDEAIRLELDNMIEKQILKSVNSIISIRKEFAILHADYYSKSGQSRECLLKVLLAPPATKKYGKKDIKLRVKKETMNFLELNKLKFSCPKIIGFKNNIIFMSVVDIGKGWINALTLQDAVLNPYEYYIAYEQIFWEIRTLYYVSKLTYVDWSASNRLWYKNRCYIIDGFEVVKLDHIDVFSVLLAVCTKFVNFFRNKVQYTPTPMEMFTRITYIKNYNNKHALVAVVKSVKEQGI